MSDAIFIESIESEDFADILEANPAAERQTGYSREDLIGMNIIDDLVVEETGSIDVEGAVERVKSGETISFTEKQKRKDGAEMWVESLVTPIEYKGKKAALSVNRDITERKEMEEELRETKRKYQKLFEVAPDPAYVIGKDGAFQEVNEAFVEKSEYDKEEIIGVSLGNPVPFLPEESRRKAVENFKKRVEVEDIPPYPLEIQTKDGRTIHAEINARPLKEDDKIVGEIGIARDITERKEVKEREEFLNTLLRQDLRSKYQAILEYLQLLGRADFSENFGEYLDEALEDAVETGEILELARELNKIEGRGWVSDKDIVKVLGEVMDDVSDLVDREGVEIEENYPERIGNVKGNYSLKTLFSEILKTRIRTTDCGEIRIDAEESEREILVRVEDDGESLLGEVKDLFSGKVYTGNTTGVGGVRYYMIRQIADYNDAEIEVKDSELGGARFDVYLQKA